MTFNYIDGKFLYLPIVHYDDVMMVEGEIAYHCVPYALDALALMI